MCTKLTAVDRLGSGIQISANFLKVPGVVSRLGSGLHVVGQLGSECDLVPIFSRIFALTAGENVLAGKGNCPGGGNFRRKMSEGGMSWGKYPTLRCLYRALLISNLCNRQTKRRNKKYRPYNRLQRDRRDKNSPDTFTTDRFTRKPNSNTIFLAQFSKTSKTIYRIQ